MMATVKNHHLNHVMQTTTVMMETMIASQVTSRLLQNCFLLYTLHWLLTTYKNTMNMKAILMVKIRLKELVICITCHHGNSLNMYLDYSDLDNR